MKKIYSIFLCSVALSVAVNAQSVISTGALTPISSVEFKNPNFNPGVLTIDTLRPPVFTMSCFTSDAQPLVYYTLGSAGMLIGNNSYGETEAAQRYTFSGNGTVSEVLIMYGHNTGTTGTTSAKVYSLSAKRPSTVLGTSGTVTVGNISPGALTSYTFATGVSVTTDFAVSSVFPTTASTGDTVAVLSTKGNCHSNDSLSYVKATAFGGWAFLNQLVNKSSPTLDTSFDIMILPVVNVTTVIQEPTNNGLTLKGSFPNPANDVANINYNINESGTVTVEVFDLSGRVIERSAENISAGNHNFLISVKNFVAGNYYYTIRTSKSQLTSKFIVVK